MESPRRSWCTGQGYTKNFSGSGHSLMIGTLINTTPRKVSIITCKVYISFDGLSPSGQPLGYLSRIPAWYIRPWHGASAMRMHRRIGLFQESSVACFSPPATSSGTSKPGRLGIRGENQNGKGQAEYRIVKPCTPRTTRRSLAYHIRAIYDDTWCLVPHILCVSGLGYSLLQQEKN